jgi:hypothetical protein
MSKYIQGIVDYIPQIQPYKPDLNFVAKVLETKEAQYKAGYDKLSGLYGTLLQSPMSRTDNNELRNDFFNRISSEIQKISSLDLSLAQNVQAASQVFQPLIEDDYIMKDMAFTKQAYNAIEEGENLKNCIDKECRGKYWEGGIRAIKYQVEDFMNAPRESTLNFSAPKYVAATNIAQDAAKFITDSKLKMTTVTQSPDGRYRITNTNGTQMIPYLNQLLYTTFGNDQASIDYFNTQAYLMRKDEIAGTASQYGSKEAAEQAYLSEKLKIINQRADEEKRLIDEQEKRVNTKTGALEDHIKNNGVDLSNDNDKQLTQEYLQSLVDKIVIGKSKEKVEEQKDKVNPEITPTLDLDAQRYRVDAAVGNELMGSVLTSVAQNYAMSTMEQEVEEDKYALAAQEHSYRMALEGSRQSFEWRKMQAEASIRDQQRRDVLRDDLLKMELKGEIEAITDANGNVTGYRKKNKDLLNPDPAGNEYTPIDPANPESTTYTDEDLKASDDKHVSDNLQGMVGQQRKVAVEIYNTLKAFTDPSKRGQAVNGIKVTDDLAEEAQYYIETVFKDYLTSDGQLVSDDEFKARNNTRAYKSSRIDQVNKMLGLMGKTAGGAKHFEPLKIASSLFGLNRNAELSAAINDLAQRTGIYERDLEDRLYNYTTVHNAIMTQAQQDILSGVDPAYADIARELLKNNNKPLLSQDEFVNKFTALAQQKYNKGELPAPSSTGLAGMDEFNTGYSLAKWYSENAPDWAGASSAKMMQVNPYVPDILRNMAYKAWNDYQDQFAKSYNNDDKGVKVELRSLKSGYTTVRKEEQGGTSVQANPMMASVDAQYAKSLANQDALEILRLTRNLSMTKGSNLTINNGSGFDVTRDNITDVIDPKAMLRLSSILSDISSANDTESRARFNLVFHPIIAGTKGKVGFTLQLDPNYLAKRQGSDKSPDVFRGLGQEAESSIHIVMDEEDAMNLDIYKRNTEGIYSRLYNGEPFTIDAFKDYGGEFTYQQNPYANDNSIMTTGYLWQYDENGNKIKNHFSDITPEGVTPDSLVASWTPILKAAYMENQQIEEMTRLSKKDNGQLITDPAQLQAYLNRQ